MVQYQIMIDDLSSEPVRALLELHLKGMMENTPADNVFALDLTGLQQPEVIVWSVWDQSNLAGIGALKQLDDGLTGELKSMRTAPDYLRKGVGAALLEYIIDYATSQNFKRLSLETGSGSSFDPALSLYRRRGFINGDAFSDYTKSDFNQFLHLAL